MLVGFIRSVRSRLSLKRYRHRCHFLDDEKGAAIFVLWHADRNADAKH